MPSLASSLHTSSTMSAMQLSGKATFDWHPSGLACTLSLPHCEGLKLGNGRALPKRTDRNTRDLSHLEAGSAVLLVEDESMVAMMVEETLAELGFCVIGPYGTLAEAMRAASSAHLDAAILDINLGGQLVYPVADLLCSKGVPVVLSPVTGWKVSRPAIPTSRSCKSRSTEERSKICSIPPAT